MKKSSHKYTNTYNIINIHRRRTRSSTQERRNVVITLVLGIMCNLFLFETNYYLSNDCSLYIIIPKDMSYSQSSKHRSFAFRTNNISEVFVEPEVKKKTHSRYQQSTTKVKLSVR